MAAHLHKAQEDTPTSASATRLWSITDNQWLITECFSSFPWETLLFTVCQRCLKCVFTSHFFYQLSKFTAEAATLHSTNKHLKHLKLSPHQHPQILIMQTISSPSQLKVLACARECESISGQSKCQASGSFLQGKESKRYHRLKIPCSVELDGNSLKVSSRSQEQGSRRSGWGHGIF